MHEAVGRRRLIQRKPVRVERRFADALDVGVDLFRREMHGEAARGAREDARVLHGAHGLTVEARVVDRDRGVVREREQQLLVVRIEAALGHVEHADRADDEAVSEAGNGNHVAGVRRAAARRCHSGCSPEAEIAPNASVVVDREVARIAVRGGDHDLSHPPPARAVRRARASSSAAWRTMSANTRSSSSDWLMRCTISASARASRALCSGLMSVTSPISGDNVDSAPPPESGERCPPFSALSNHNGWHPLAYGGARGPHRWTTPFATL